MTAVLFVDADRTIFSCVSHIFEKYGSVSLFHVSCGEEALAWLSRYHADVIVSDYNLPQMNAIELLHTLRSQGFSIPFIFFTEDDTSRLKYDAYREDVFGVIPRNGLEKKPILKLLRLICWASGGHEVDYPFSTEE
ncbi:MAG: response regulator [Methanoregula sp.]|nr:MAG: response regulator [Methanoregula sp.]